MQGLFQKYIVTRTDGEERPGAKYVVLRYDGWNHIKERAALMYYGLDLFLDTEGDCERFGEELMAELKPIIYKYRKKKWEEHKELVNKKLEE